MKTVSSFAEIEQEFIARAHQAVWCSLATLDTKNRLRSRIIHPIWEGSTGWIATRRNSLKAKHLAHNPFVSLAWIADITRPAYADCLAEWDDTPAGKQRVWDMFTTAPPPLGYDPTPFFHSVDHPDFGVLKLTPWRVELMDVTVGETTVWQQRNDCP